MNYQYRSRTPGFTLIELLVVMGIIMILAGIVIGVQRGVYYQQSKARAVAEMRTIASGLESFKLTYGDYPPMTRPSVNTSTGASTNLDQNRMLFNALTGKARLSGGSSGPRWEPGSDDNKNPPIGKNLTVVGPVFIDESSIKRGGSTTSPENYWVDPWGNPYHYYYKTVDEYGNASGWGDINTFILVSAGPRASGDPPFAHAIYSAANFEILSNTREFMDNQGGTGPGAGKPRKDIIHGSGN